MTTSEWQRQVATIEVALASFGATGDVLELAGSTGWWTERLARTANRLTVVDSSPETLALSRARLGRPDVNCVVADLFEWQPRRRYDVVFFSFWLSHVPRSRFDPFWQLVRSSLAAGAAPSSSTIATIRWARRTPRTPSSPSTARTCTVAV
jgi:trans-aconitate methyltransferase